MILPLQNFTTLLENMSAGLQGSSAQLVDLSVGSVLRALLEACASVALWMQWLILQVLSVTRAATSTGTDLDSWMADFSLVRLPGAPSGGSVTFSRYTPVLATVIPLGTVVRTTDGTLSFTVIEDTSNSAWNGSSGYVLAAALGSVVVPVQASAPGASGNILAGAIGLIGSAIPAVDNVTNASNFVGGVDSESDAALRARFQMYINSRSLATAGAIGAAVQSLQQGLRYSVRENVDLEGQAAPGNFCVIVDDGTGVASNTLLAEVSSAVEAVRPLGSTYSVTAPVQTVVTVQMSLLTSDVEPPETVSTNVQQAILAWVDQLPMGGTLAISKLEAIAHATDSSIVSVTSTLINGQAVDIQVAPGGVIEAAAVTVSAS